MVNVLVVGGMGFIGAELVRQLRIRGDKVCILDRIKSEDKLVESLVANLVDQKTLNAKLAGKTFDVIYHLASFPGDTGNAREMMDLNVTGLMNMLDWAKVNPVKRFVITGSICAYGWYPTTKFKKPKYLPVDEEYSVGSQDIKDMYCATKRMQELLAVSYYNLYKIPTSVLRLTAVIGPAGKGGGRGWRDFAIGLKGGKHVQVHLFTPEEKYHFVDIRDVARAHIMAGEHPKAVGEIFNIAAKTPTVGTDFVKAIAKVAPTVKVEFGYTCGMTQGEDLWFDVSKAHKLIGFEAQYNLEDSIRNIKEWVDAGGLETDSGGNFDR